MINLIVKSTALETWIRMVRWSHCRFYFDLVKTAFGLSSWGETKVDLDVSDWSTIINKLIQYVIGTSQ